METIMTKTFNMFVNNEVRSYPRHAYRLEKGSDTYKAAISLWRIIYMEDQRRKEKSVGDSEFTGYHINDEVIGIFKKTKPEMVRLLGLDQKYYQKEGQFSYRTVGIFPAPYHGTANEKEPDIYLFAPEDDGGQSFIPKHSKKLSEEEAGVLERGMYCGGHSTPFALFAPIDLVPQ